MSTQDKEKFREFWVYVKSRDETDKDLWWALLSEKQSNGLHVIEKRAVYEVEKRYEAKIDEFYKRHDDLKAKCDKLVDALEFYATLADKNRDEANLKREFGCGCCAGTNDKNGQNDYDSDVQGSTARQALAEFRKDKR